MEEFISEQKRPAQTTIWTQETVKYPAKAVDQKPIKYHLWLEEATIHLRKEHRKQQQ